MKILKTIFSSIKGYIVVLWFILTVITFIVALNFNDYWNIWAFSSLLITLIYGIVYYVDYLYGVLPLFRGLEDRKDKLINCAVGFLIFLIIGIAIYSLNMYITNKMWNSQLKYFEIFSLLTLFFFLIEDILVGKIVKWARSKFDIEFKDLESLPDQCNPHQLASEASNLTSSKVRKLLQKGKIKGEQINDEWIMKKEDILSWYSEKYLSPLDHELYVNIVKFVDIPTLGAVITIIFFCKFVHNKVNLEMFSLGATAFQLLAFNIVFSILLISGLFKKSKKMEPANAQ